MGRILLLLLVDFWIMSPYFVSSVILTSVQYHSGERTLNKRQKGLLALYKGNKKVFAKADYVL